MLHLGLGFSKLALASRVAQAGTPAGVLVLKAGTPGALVLSHGGALQQSFQALHTAPRLDMRVTGLLGSAMTQKKRRIDPGQEKAKEDRRRKRLTKALKKMDKKERQPKPLSECEVPLALQKEAIIRKREVTIGEEESEARIAQMKDWQRYTIKRHSNELWHLDKVLKAQNKALEELRAENESLYEAAIQFDPNLLGTELKGPCASPPVPGYLQDGEYKDTTPTFKVIYEDTEAFMKTLLLEGGHERRKERRR